LGKFERMFEEEKKCIQAGGLYKGDQAMTYTPARIQPFIRSQRGCSEPDIVELPELRERLDLLVPSGSPSALCNLQDYALAYIEQYRSNTVALEHEWDFLSTMLDHAWQQEQYEVVARLAAALAYPAGRRHRFAEAKHVLQLGIVASRRIQDRRCFASLLNRFGGLMFTHGRYQQGHRLWHTGLSYIESDGPPQGLWEPLYSFTQIVDTLGNYAAAQHFLGTYYCDSRSDDPDGLAVALFARGLYARFMGDMDKASTDFSHCLSLLLPQTLSPSRQLFMITVQAELARAQGYYARSQQYTQSALLLAQAFGDLHIFATLLIDEGVFASWKGRLDDTQRVVAHLRAIVSQVEFPNVAVVNQILEQRLLESGALPPQLDLSVPSTELPGTLSARETEVLQLVAKGLSSREIARCLVITPATVKKHLEHIYTRLDVHNRTSALAQARRLRILA
jgi:DNA-binding CsgD family transcriptional regulator